MHTYRAWSPQRNGNYKLIDQHPIEKYDDAVHSGNVLQDGFEVMAKADPQREGDRPDVRGTEYPLCRGYDRSFEQSS
jgi:hypothetical protein